MGISTIMKMTIGLLVASLFISAATIGSLGGAIKDGISDITDATDFTTDVSDKQTLSDLAMFVEHRAVNEGCALVEEVNSGIDGEEIDGVPDWSTLEGYKGLRGTRLGQYPECYGGEASVIRDQFNFIPGRGTFGGGPDENYMPGIYSREQFRITEDITLDTSSRDTRLEEQLGGATHEKTLNQIGDEQRNSGDDGIDVVRVAMFMVSPAGYASYTLYKAWSSGDDTDVANPVIIFETHGITPDERMDKENNIMKVQLCPGDEGYMQANREYIDNENFSDDEPLYPVIVVQELGDNCGTINIDRTGKIPDEASTSGRLLHITGDTSKDNHEYVRGPGAGGSRTDYAFDLHNLNEDEDEVKQGVYSAAANGINFNHYSSSADKCIIGMWDHRSSGVDSTGYIYIDQGTHIDYDGYFPSRDSPFTEDLLGDRTDRSLPPRPSTKNLYDQYAEKGFTEKDWERHDVEDKILYDFGSREFALYGDLLCGEHNRNDEFEDHHSKWYMCDGDRTEQADGETWTCTPDGKWTN